jgi:hypothetical protein
VAAAIEKEFGLASELVGGRGGVFEVRLDGDEVFRNDPVLCGVPEDGAVLDALRGALG